MGIMWNVCAYADEDITDRLSKISTLRSAVIYATTDSLNKEALDRLKDANASVQIKVKVYSNKLVCLTIKKEG